MVTKLCQFSANYGNVGQMMGWNVAGKNRPCCGLNYKLDNMSDIGIQLCYIINRANLKFLTLDPNFFPQIHLELTFTMTQFASGGRLTPNTRVRKIQTIVATVVWNNCPRLWPAVLLLTLNTQRQNVHSSGREPFLPKSQTIVHPCCHGHNMPFC